MRQFRTLFRVDADEQTGVLYIVGEKGTHDYPSLMVRREGDYVPISVSYGPIEFSLRLGYDDLARTLGRLQPVDGLQTTRQVGSTSAFIAFGLHHDGELIMRPTLVIDARGHLAVNLKLTPEARDTLLNWLQIQMPQTSNQ